MSTNSREEYEAYMLVVRPNANVASLEQIVKNATFRAQDLDVANALRGMPIDEAVKAHPVLTISRTALSVIEKRAVDDGLSRQQREAVLGQAKENLARLVEKGIQPKVTLIERQPLDKRGRDR